MIKHETCESNKRKEEVFNVGRSDISEVQANTDEKEKDWITSTYELGSYN